MRTSREMLWSIVLAGLSSAASACDLPPLAAVPAPSGLSEEQRRAVHMEVSAYFEAVKAYTACVQVQIVAAGGDEAPGYREVLVNRRNAAVAEAAAILRAFEEYPRVPADPGSEAALRRLIDEYARGKPNYDLMTPEAARVVRRTERNARNSIPFEKLESVTFLSTNALGADVYLVRVGAGAMLWEISLSADGKISRSAVQFCIEDGRFVDPLSVTRCTPPNYLSPDRIRELLIADGEQ